MSGDRQERSEELLRAEHKKAEEELIKSRQLLQTIYDAMPDAVVVADMNFNIISCNQAVYRVLGYEPEELVGKNYAVLIPEARLVHPEHKKRMAELLEKGHLRDDDYLIKRKNGETFPASFTAAVVRDEQGNNISLVGTIRDVTERKKIEREIIYFKSLYEGIIDELL